MESKNTIKMEVSQGYWNINDKPLKNCSIAKKNFFAQFVKMRLVKSGISEQRTFKSKAQEIKEKYNYKFANLNKQISNDLVEKHPNIETLIFERKK